jgi:hypothetical protein
MDPVDPLGLSSKLSPPYFGPYHGTLVLESHAEICGGQGVRNGETLSMLESDRRPKSLDS